MHKNKILFLRLNLNVHIQNVHKKGVILVHKKVVILAHKLCTKGSDISAQIVHNLCFKYSTVVYFLFIHHLRLYYLYYWGPLAFLFLVPTFAESFLAFGQN